MLAPGCSRQSSESFILQPWPWASQSSAGPPGGLAVTGGPDRLQPQAKDSEGEGTEPPDMAVGDQRGSGDPQRVLGEDADGAKEVSGLA